MNLVEYLLCLLTCSWLWPDQARARRLEASEHSRTVGPWLYLLAYPAALQQVGGGALPGIPIRRPQDETPLSSANIQAPTLSDEVPSGQNNVIREQFLQGILQGLQQSGGGASGATVSPALLADFLSQVPSLTNTSTTRQPAAEKDANKAGSDENYDYIDFQNGSRIKYDLDVEQKPVNKILQQTTRRQAVARPRPQAQPQTYLYYAPYTSYYYRGG
ncbi:uncharacterized protein LOC117592494 [Drosophila guanche]|uniref:Uncharacterized protein n=1 Tax=Drosophila guanche TaxID=7266 RepID=A0A3B0JMD2_DROGU|nr:uncharacterized protein LOC117592494 [Drosophila guanche]SPP73801.1 Hypothetical predicted protein [Drosophila guanche]